MKNEIVRSTSKSGISGVRFHKPKTARVGWWIAVTYTGFGSALYKSFPIKVHGDEGAKMMAIAERQRQLEQLKQMRLERIETCPLTFPSAPQCDSPSQREMRNPQ